MALRNDSINTINSSTTDSTREISPSSSSAPSSSSLSSSSSTSPSSSEVSHPNVTNLVQYQIQLFVYDPTISTIPISQTHQAAEHAIVQDAQRRIAAQLQAFDIAFNNAAASGSGNTLATNDDSMLRHDTL